MADVKTQEYVLPPEVARGADDPPPPIAAGSKDEEFLRGLASKYGASYEPSDLSNLIYKNPEDRDAYRQALEAQYKLRGAPNVGRTQDSQSGFYDTRTHQAIPNTPAAMPTLNAASWAQTPGASRTNFNYQNPGDQFSDPYTKSLEDLVKQQLTTIQQPQTNPQLDKLLGFLDTRFNELATNPGYSPAELAMLRTQALDPIEQDRAAAQKRSLDRIGARGMLPSSGLAELDARGVDLNYDRLRGAAERDLAVNALNRRDQNLNQALQLGGLAGIQIPQQQRAEDQSRRNEALSLASLLYQLPRNAMNDSLAVINGSPAPGDLFSQAIQLLNVQNSQRNFNQQRNDAMMEALGNVIGNIFRNG